jgi:hypothetical protein
VHVALCVFDDYSLELPPWPLKAFEKVMKGFHWTGTDEDQGGKCLVTWSRLQRPLQLGVLGILDFRLMGCTLRLRWLWLSKMDLTR